MDEKIGSVKSDVSTLKSDVSTLKSDVSTLKSDVSTLKSDVSTLKSDVSTLKSDVSTLKSDISRIDRKLDAVFEQTAILLEFKTDATQKLDKIIEDNRSFYEVIGEHEVSIRSMRRILTTT
ncbi:MAG: DUF2730 family protein [Bacillota bacterium]